MQELQKLRDDGFLSDALLRHAVKSIKASDPRFDWVGIYLLDAERHDLWLHNYVGKPTTHGRIAIGEGVCGTAVARRENMNVPDVSAIDNYISCDPRVKSEMVVLIRAGDEIFGQIDIDSRSPAAFTEADDDDLQAVAAKLAEQLVAERR